MTQTIIPTLLHKSRGVRETTYNEASKILNCSRISNHIRIRTLSINAGTASTQQISMDSVIVIIVEDISILRSNNLISNAPETPFAFTISFTNHELTPNIRIPLSSHKLTVRRTKVYWFFRSTCKEAWFFMTIRM